MQARKIRQVLLLTYSISSMNRTKEDNNCKFRIMMPMSVPCAEPKIYKSEEMVILIFWLEATSSTFKYPNTNDTILFLEEQRSKWFKVEVGSRSPNSPTKATDMAVISSNLNH